MTDNHEQQSAPNVSASSAEVPQTELNGVFGLVFGVVGLFGLLCIVVIPFPFIGLILSRRSLKKHDNEPGRWIGRNVAVAGFWLSAFGALMIVGLFVFGFVLGFMSQR